MFTIIGIDNKEYGPVPAEEVKKWILEGRVNEQTLAKSEATGEWKRLGEFPEFAETFASLRSPPPITEQSMSIQDWTQNVLSKDYDLRVGECVSRGFNLYKQNFGLLFGASIIYVLITVAVHLLTMIPIIGLLVIPVQVCLSALLLGGLYYIFISKFRGKQAEVGDLFHCFKHNPLQLILTIIVVNLLVLASAIAGAVIAGLTFFGGFVAKSSVIAKFGLVIGTIAAIIPMIYLSVCWSYSIPLVVDKNLDFWTAMKLSFKKVKQHWFSVLWLLIVMVLIGLAGALVCGVGIFFAFPLIIAAFIYGYETIFGDSNEVY